MTGWLEVLKSKLPCQRLNNCSLVLAYCIIIIDVSSSNGEWLTFSLNLSCLWHFISDVMVMSLLVLGTRHEHNMEHYHSNVKDPKPCVLLIVDELMKS